MTITTNTNTDRKVRLTVYSSGKLPVARVARFWTAVDNAYTSLSDFEDSVPYLILFRSSIFHDPKSLRAFIEGRGHLLPVVRVQDMGNLEFARIEVNSPGFWEVIGKWMPLETIRKSLNDAHERRKDRNYREDAEAEKLRLENTLLKTKALQEMTKMMRDAGLSENDIQTAVSQWVINPLHKMNEAGLDVVERSELED